MNAEAEFFTRYLRARLGECTTRPELHRNMQAGYEKNLAMLIEDPEKYFSESGDLFDIMKAEQCDLAENSADLYSRLGYHERKEAFQKIAAAARDGKSHADLMQKLTSAQRESEPLKNHDFDLQGIIGTIASCLVIALSSTPEEKPGKESVVRGEWIKLLDLYPGATWDWIKNSPYRACLWYDDERLDLLGAALDEILSKGGSR